MHEVSWVAAGAVLLIVIAIALAWRYRGRQPDVPEPAPGPALEPPIDDGHPEPLLAYPTGRPGEVLAVGPPADLDALGPAVVSLPDQLARHVETLLAGLEGARALRPVGARLVRLDSGSDTATLGTESTAGAGGLLTLRRTDSGAFTRATRLGDGIVEAAALTGAFSAMALQAQLGRIEDGIEHIAFTLDRVAREQQILADSSRDATATVLADVQTAALGAGELTAAAWSQVSHLAQPILTAVNADRRRLEDALTALENLAGASVGTRNRQVEAATENVIARYRDYADSCHSWVRFASLRLWHLTIIDDPSLRSYTQQLHGFIDDAGNLRSRQRRLNDALDRIGDFSELVHFIARRTLPHKLAEQRRLVAAIDWSPLSLDSDGGAAGPAPATS